MATTIFQISIPVMEWIAANQRTTLEGLADIVAPSKSKRIQFLSGKINKTQAEQLTKLANIPFGFLFLKHPPKLEKPTLPDFRTVQNSDPLTDNFYDVLQDTLDKAEWYKDYLRNVDALPEKLPFVGKFSLRNKVKPTIDKVVLDIKETINYEFNKELTKDSYFRYISDLLENVGMLVFKNGVVKNNSRRGLNVREFRGFAIADIQLPIIFINGKDAASAQLFTLIHEVAHIWIGETGISNLSMSNEDEIEQFCNKVAAEFLVPTENFLNEWDVKIEISENLQRLSSYFKVSRFVIAIKAVQHKLVTGEVIHKIRQENLQQSIESKSSGGNFYNAFPVKNSRKFTHTVTAAAIGQQILLREGAKLLNTTPATLVNYYQKNKGDF